MEKMEYKVVFVYADGHIEEIDDTFSSEEKAIQYGEELLGQVKNTESYLGSQERGLFKRKKKPYFMVIQISEGTYHMVYESKQYVY